MNKYKKFVFYISIVIIIFQISTCAIKLWLSSENASKKMCIYIYINIFIQLFDFMAVSPTFKYLSVSNHHITIKMLWQKKSVIHVKSYYYIRVSTCTYQRTVKML